MADGPQATDLDELEARKEVQDLEERLSRAKARLRTNNIKDQYRHLNAPIANIHDLLLLSDSALPLGSFAFSSGLESFLAHQSGRSRTSVASFSHFLELSLASISCSTLPYLRAAHQHPETLLELDNDLDASTLCPCARRASVAQGKALAAVWERSLRKAVPRESLSDSSQNALVGLDKFCADLKASNLVNHSELSSRNFELYANGHLAPLMGALCAVIGMPLDQSLYMFLLNHSKTLLSAGIRASVLGPYQAQSILAGTRLRSIIETSVQNHLNKRPSVEDAAQCVPMLDMWGGRHEIVYSRVFNS